LGKMKKIVVKYRVRARKHVFSEECRDLTEAVAVMRKVNNSLGFEALQISGDGTTNYSVGVASKLFYVNAGGAKGMEVVR
jgi:hypothetical protein